MFKTLLNIALLYIIGAFSQATAEAAPLELQYAPDRKVDIIHIKLLPAEAGRIGSLDAQTDKSVLSG